jgi:hypothetical protein
MTHFTFLQILFQTRHHLLPLRLLPEGCVCAKRKVSQDLQKVPREREERPRVRLRRERLPLRVRDEEEDVRVSEQLVS